MSGASITLNLGAANSKKKKLEVRDVFNMDEDSEEITGPKKRKLVPLDYDESQNKQNVAPNNNSDSNKTGSSTISKDRKDKSSNKSGNHTTNSGSGNNLGDENAPPSKKSNDEILRNQEEKRRHIKSIIDKIPTEKNDLFNYNLDWNEIDSTLMDKKIRPWINKKIIEYIGEPEPTLVDFICSKVMAGSSPQGILDDVQMVCFTFSSDKKQIQIKNFFRI